MPSSDATRRASSTALSEQHPPCFADSSMSPRGHCCSVTPTTSWPCACKSAAATDESTPPDIATATFMERKLPSSRSHDLPRHYLRILTNAGEDRRFELSHPVHTHEVEARRRSLPVHLHWKANLIEDRKLHEAVFGPVSRRPDHGADPLLPHVELAAGVDPQRLGDFVFGPRYARPVTQRIRERPEIRVARVAKICAHREIVSKAELSSVHPDESAEELHSVAMQRPQRKVVTSAMTRPLRIAQQSRRRRRQLVGSAIEET